MAVKVTRKCTRCRREDEVSAESMDAAQQVEDVSAAKEEGAENLKKLIASLDGPLPDLFVVFNGEIISHANLCLQNGEPKKRSCFKRVGDLVEELKELEVKTRKKKGADTEAATEPTQQ